MMDLFLDASAMKCWLDCREQYRLRYLEDRVSQEPSFHQAIGIAVHLAAESHNLGKSFEYGLQIAAESLAGFPEHLLNPYKQQRFRELASELPSMVAAYFDTVDNSDLEMVAVEEEWSHAFLAGIVLCGRKDKVARCGNDTILFDLKTASEIGKTWSADFRATMLRDFGLGLYDWHECQIGRAPKTIKVECLVKPYKGKESRLEVFNLPEITQYRTRFARLLEWTVREIKHYHESYGNTSPWPMAQGQCQTKYGACEYLPGCLQGWTPKTLANYTNRQEHLQIRIGSNERDLQSIQKSRDGE